MANWKTYKGQSPWEVEPITDKVIYNEGDRLTSISDVLWHPPGQGNPPVSFGHVPCGYWNRNYVPESSGIKIKFLITATGCVYITEDNTKWNKYPISQGGTVIWNGNIFCMRSNLISKISCNGIDWVAGSDNINETGWFAWSGFAFITVYGVDYSIPEGRALLSADGLSWTQREICDLSPNISGFYGIAWGDNKFVATGVKVSSGHTVRGALIYTSLDGITWTAQAVPSPGPIALWKPLYWNGSIFITWYGTGVLKSNDGENWTWHANVLPLEFAEMAWNGSVWCATRNGDQAYVSSDGLNWDTYALPYSITGVHIAWNGEYFYIIGTSTEGFRSTNGQIWETVLIDANKTDAFYDICGVK